jgi:serine/threonine protein phosphatase 1
LLSATATFGSAADDSSADEPADDDGSDDSDDGSEDEAASEAALGDASGALDDAASDDELAAAVAIAEDDGALEASVVIAADEEELAEDEASSSADDVADIASDEDDDAGAAIAIGASEDDDAAMLAAADDDEEAGSADDDVADISSVEDDEAGAAIAIGASEDDDAAMLAAADDDEEAGSADDEDEAGAAIAIGASDDALDEGATDEEDASATAIGASDADDEVAPTASPDDEDDDAAIGASAEDDAAIAIGASDDEALTAAVDDDEAGAEDDDALAALEDDGADDDVWRSEEASEAAAASELALASAADDAASSSAAAEVRAEALDADWLLSLLLQALSRRAAASVSGRAAVSLICMGESSYWCPGAGPSGMVTLPARRDCFVATNGILRDTNRPSIRISFGKRHGNVDCRGHDHGVEEERKDGVNQHQAAHGVGDHIDVGRLGGHADDVGKVDEGDAARLLRRVEVEAFGDLAGLPAAFAAPVRLVVLVGVMHRPHGVHGEPAQHHRGDAESELHRGAVIFPHQHEKQGYNRGAHRQQHRHQDEGGGLVFFRCVLAQEIGSKLARPECGQHRIGQEKRIGGRRDRVARRSGQQHGSNHQAEHNPDHEILVAAQHSHRSVRDSRAGRCHECRRLSVAGNRLLRDMTHPRLAFHSWPAAVYAIGDVHGCIDQLEALEARIAEDGRDVEGEKWLITIGDHIDRGPNSRAAVEHVMRPAPAGFRRFSLLGNHEAMLLDFLRNPAAHAYYLDEGGLETLRSYDIDLAYPPLRSARDTEGLLASLFPPAHAEFLAGLPLYVSLPGWLFVHAGIRPGIPLALQEEDDLVWIRAPFLTSQLTGGLRVVHGHTPGPDVVVTPHRIDVDTHCFHTGTLSAVRVTPDGRTRFLSVSGAASGWRR